MFVSRNMTLTRTQFLLALSGAAGSAADTPKMHIYERQDFVVDDFQASGHILDIGGGGEGIIGQMKPAQVIAIDLSKRELEEAPPGPLKIVMDATDLKFLDASFDTLTAFFSLMYMRPEIQKKAFAEAFRVLRPGGRWMVWDAAIPLAFEKDTRGPVFRFRFHLSRQGGRDGVRNAVAREAHGSRLLQDAGARGWVQDHKSRGTTRRLPDPQTRIAEAKIGCDDGCA